MGPPQRNRHGVDDATLAEYRSALQELEDAATEVSEVFQRVAEAERRSKEHVDSGGRVSDLPATIELRDLRARISSSLDRFNAARKTTRTMTAVLAAAEGTSQSEVAREFGVSRQHISKLVGESLANEDHDPADAG